MAGFQPVCAQAPAPPWIQFTVVQVEPEMVEEYMALQRELGPHVKRTGAPWRLVARTELFGDAHRFLIATPLQNLSGFDQSKPDPEITALTQRAQRYVRSQQNYGLRTIPEIDHPLPDKQRPALLVVNLVQVVPGREQDYFQLMQAEFLPHFNKAGIHHLSGSLAFGGKGGYIHLFYVPSFARLDEGSPVVRALGAQGAQEVTAKFSGIVVSSELWIARFLPDLSHGPWSNPTK